MMYIKCITPIVKFKTAMVKSNLCDYSHINMNIYLLKEP